MRAKHIYIDGSKGDDKNPGTKRQPLRSLEGWLSKIPLMILERKTTVGVLAHPCNMRPGMVKIVDIGPTAPPKKLVWKHE